MCVRGKFEAKAADWLDHPPTPPPQLGKFHDRASYDRISHDYDYDSQCKCYGTCRKL